MRKIKVLVILFILMATSFSILVPSVVHASSPVDYVPVTLTNSQTTATPANFQQLLKIDWSTYSSYLNSNVSNVRFYNSTSFSSSSELSGWIETNNTTTATSSNVWVNLSGTIVPASGTATIYMAFLSKTASWSSHWGLAPELSTVYGEFDNGKNIFEYYQHWGGLSSLPTGWSEISGTSVTFGTSYTIVSAGGADGAWYGIYLNPLPSSFSSTTIAWDLYGNMYDGANGGSYIGTATAGGGNFNGYSFSEGTTSTSLIYFANGGNQFLATTGHSDANYNKIYSMEMSSPSTLSMALNYTSIYSTSGATSESPTYFDIDPSKTSEGLAASPITVYWIDVRQIPPDNVMPSATFGTTTPIGVTGYQIAFQQTSLPSGTKWGIRLNNTTVVTWQNTTGQYDNLTDLPAGSYTFQVINATGYASNPYLGLLTIVSTNLTQAITFTGYLATFTESGLPAGDTWYVNLSDQSGLSELTTGQKLSGTTTSLSAHEPNGTYTFTYQTSDKRYSGGTGTFTVNGASVTEDVTFSVVLYYLNFTDINKPKAVEWGVNVSGTIKIGYGNLSFQLTNGTYYWNASAINTSFDHPLGWWRLTNGSGTVLLHNESSFPGIKFVMNGKNYNNNITFARAYNITFEEVGIANTFQWDVNLSNGLGITLDKHIVVSNSVTQVFFNSTEGNYTNSSYSGTIQTPVYGPTGTRYINFTSSSISETVHGSNPIVPYDFTTQYLLTVESVPSTGGYHSPNSEWVNASGTVQLTARANSGYEFTGFQGSGVSSYTGMGYYSSGEYITTITMTNPITEVMDFNSYIVLTFYMQNLTSGQEWGIKLSDPSGLVQWNNGTGYYIVFDIPQGNYTYLVTGVTATPQSNQITVSTSTEMLLQYDITTYNVDFQEIGLQPGTSWNMRVFSEALSLSSAGTSSILNFEIPNGTYSYFAASVYGYMSNNSTGSFVMHGSSLLIYVNWTQGNALILQHIRNFVPITINTTNFSIPAGAQIPININWSRYTAYENHNLSNVLFMNSTFYPLFAWIESGANSSSTKSEVWVKITSSISSFSSTTLYLAWQTRNTNNFNRYGYLGEAPQLSSVYGEYDNIAMVMDPGLLVQIYINTTSLVSAITPTPILNANFTQGTTISEGGALFRATTQYMVSPGTGTPQEVYLGVSGVGYSPYAVEQNVLLSYQLFAGNTGTWPSPPLTDSTASFLAKAQGFVIMNQQQTDWYIIDDDGRYLQISGASQGYLNNGWTYGTPISDFLGDGGNSNQVSSGESQVLGSARISFLYNQYYEEALWQFWTNSPVTYWHPIPIQGFNSSAQVSFGAVESSYSSFYEYGLPVGTNWSIAVSGPGVSKLYTTNSNLIYTYLPNGTYLYTVGSMVNGSYHSGIDGKFIPSPESGHVIVTGAFTVQVIIFEINEVLKYNLDPEQASGVADNVTLPILAVNIQGLPAGNTTISNIISHLTAKLIAKNQSQNQNLTWTLSSSKYGMIVIFLHIGKVQIQAIRSGTAVVSFVAAFQLGTISEIAAGVAGPTVFDQVNTSGPPPPSGLNFSSPQSFLQSLNGPLSELFGAGPVATHLAEVATIVIAAIAAYYLERIRKLHDEADRHVRAIRKKRGQK